MFDGYKAGLLCHSVDTDVGGLTQQSGSLFHSDAEQVFCVGFLQRLMEQVAQIAAVDSTVGGYVGQGYVFLVVG